jgi:hypothetical protein
VEKSKRIVLGINEEIGADISYVRRKHGDQDAAYFTGIEIGILFGGTVLANFLLGMLKGATEEVTTAGGKQLGKSLAKKLIEKLTPIANQAQFKEADTTQLAQLAASHEQELDSVCTTLIADLTKPEFDRLVDGQDALETAQIRDHLARNGFTTKKVEIYSERLVRRIRLELKSE